MEVRYVKEIVDPENTTDVNNAVDFEATVNSKDAEAVDNAINAEYFENPENVEDVKDAEYIADDVNAEDAKNADAIEGVKNSKYAANNCSDLIAFSDLLILAKSGDDKSKEKLIKKYYGLIIHQTKGIFLNGYTFDDLVQTGIESVLKGINNFDIEKGIEGFNAYVFWSIKNNFNYLCRKEIRHNKCVSLNMVVKDNMESIDFIQSNETLEEVVFKTITSEELLFCIELLDKEELELISFLYLNETNGKKAYLSKYAELKGKDYYYCTNLKRRALKKLKSALH